MIRKCLNSSYCANVKLSKHLPLLHRWWRIPVEESRALSELFFDILPLPTKNKSHAAGLACRRRNSPSTVTGSSHPQTQLGNPLAWSIDKADCYLNTRAGVNGSFLQINNFHSNFFRVSMLVASYLKLDNQHFFCVKKEKNHCVQRWIFHVPGWQ